MFDIVDVDNFNMLLVKLYDVWLSTNLIRRVKRNRGRSNQVISNYAFFYF